MTDKHCRYNVEAWDILQYLFKVKKINDHTLHFVAAFSGSLDLDRLKKAVNLSAEAFPLIKCRFSEAGRNPCWEDIGCTADEMVTFSESDNADESINRFICNEIDAFAGPQVKLKIIRSGGNDTLAVLMNHMLCDAAGFKDYLYMLSDIYSNLENNPAYRPAASGNRKIGQILKSFSVREKLKIMTSKDDISTHDPAKFKLEGDLRTPFIKTRKIPGDDFCRLKACAKKHNATVNDIMLTAYIRVLYQLFGRTVTIPCTVDLRKYLLNHKAEGICNLCANLTCDIGHEVGKSFEQTLCMVNLAMKKEKSNISRVKSLILLEKVFEILPYKAAKKIVDKSFSNAPIAFTNIGILDKTRISFGSTGITDAYMTGSIKYSPYFQMALSTYDNQATLSINLYGTQSDRNTVSMFLEKVVHELQSADC